MRHFFVWGLRINTTIKKNNAIDKNAFENHDHLKYIEILGNTQRVRARRALSVQDAIIFVVNTNFE